MWVVVSLLRPSTSDNHAAPTRLLPAIINIVVILSRNDLYGWDRVLNVVKHNLELFDLTTTVAKHYPHCCVELVSYIR